ncbi:secretory calcium-binding phosphoprotein 9 [Brachyistius frenatus]|uniref:secretory calcium-binding phosphoprotein 9 n=1 Tax=Brachyistius frenatus TaxID=100188 RepID=UPI0037E74FD0
MLAALNGGLISGANPGLMAGGFNPPVVAGGGADFIGQPQFAQFVPAVPAFAVPAPIPNVYRVPAVNALPFMGVPQMAQINPNQGPLMRQIMKSESTLKATVDTQIPAPAASTAATTTGNYDEDNHQEDN